MILLVVVVVAATVMTLYTVHTNHEEKMARLEAEARSLGPTKVTLIALGGALALVLPEPVAKELALHEQGRLTQSVQEVSAEAGLQLAGPLSARDLADLSDEGRSGLADAKIERVVSALEEAGYDVAVIDDPEAVEGAYGDLAALAEDPHADSAQGLGFRGILLRSTGPPTHVFVLPSGRAYHGPRCQYAAPPALRTTVAEARAEGYTPCGLCHPPRLP